MDLRRRAAASPGQHTDEVLERAAKYAAERIAELRREGVIA